MSPVIGALRRRRVQAALCVCALAALAAYDGPREPRQYLPDRLHEAAGLWRGGEIPRAEFVLMAREDAGSLALTPGWRSPGPDPAEAPVHRAVGNALEEAGMYWEALDWYDHALAADAFHTRTLADRAALADMLGMHGPAMDSYGRTLRWDPAHMLSRMGGDPARRAVELGHIDALLRADPDNHFLMAARGLVMERAGDRDGASLWYDMALGAEPRATTALVRKHAIAAGAGMHAEAAAYLERLLAIFDDGIPDATERAAAMYDAGRSSRGGEYIARAAEMARDRLDAVAAKAEALHGMGRDAEALALVDVALESAPDDPLYLANRAAGLHQAGRHAEALAVVDRLRQVHEILDGPGRGGLKVIYGGPADLGIFEGIPRPGTAPGGGVGADEIAYLDAVLEGYPSYSRHYGNMAVGGPYLD
ncbi:MAG: tetratricopeptide repeat protein [Nitrosopumilus sp.]|nr:tetratricopeptide repeat protein [Nitrosopumilus sp.]MDA7942398.1 tetratricopeptide repeat protein [Nitrosopumilus sp.]